MSTRVLSLLALMSLVPVSARAGEARPASLSTGAKRQVVAELRGRVALQTGRNRQEPLELSDGTKVAWDTKRDVGTPERIQVFGVTTAKDAPVTRLLTHKERAEVSKIIRDERGTGFPVEIRQVGKGVVRQELRVAQSKRDSATSASARNYLRLHEERAAWGGRSEPSERPQK